MYITFYKCHVLCDFLMLSLFVNVIFGYFVNNFEYFFVFPNYYFLNFYKQMFALSLILLSYFCNFGPIYF